MSYCRNRLSEPVSLMIVQRLRGARQEEAGNVEGVDRLDQQPDAFGLQALGGEFQVLDQRRLRRLARDAGRHDAGQAIELLDAQHPRIADRFADAVLEFGDARRMAGDAAFAGGPVAGRQVVQHQVELIAVELVGDLVGVEGIRKQEFDAAKAGARRRLETVHEIHAR